MKYPLFIIIITGLALPHASAAEDHDTTMERLRLHQGSSAKLADEQDELSADVQQLIIEQTMEPVIQLLREVEEIMDEVTDRLVESDTGGETIAAQTEIIEKILAAARQRQSEGGSCESGGAMMDMMERMAGQGQGEGEGEGEAQGEGEGEGEGDGGDGATGESDSTGEGETGDTAGKVEARRVPKASGTAGRGMPDEFRSALDAYNRGMERMTQ